MEISSNNQLIPYFQGTREVQVFRRPEPDPPTIQGYASETSNAKVRPLIALKNAVRPREPESIYNLNSWVASFRLKRLGLRIDVYA
jgi:hypothetical protein